MVAATYMTLISQATAVEVRNRAHLQQLTRKQLPMRHPRPLQLHWRQRWQLPRPVLSWRWQLLQRLQPRFWQLHLLKLRLRLLHLQSLQHGWPLSSA